MDTTVAVLLYGDHADLARRCLTPILPAWRSGGVVLRVGCNDVSAATRAVLAELGLEEVAVHAPAGRPDYPKYPMMRRLLHEPRVATELVMWFDDDSFVRPGHEGTFFGWAAGQLRAAGLDLMGSPYVMPISPAQCDWIAAQPWYTGLPPQLRDGGRAYVRFVTGGWWLARAEVLYKYDYPWPELRHNGGDSMLGALCQQQGLRAGAPPAGIGELRARVAINADAAGGESRSPRRGLSERPVGWDYRKDPRCSSR